MAKLQDIIKFDKAQGNFVIAAEYTQAEVDKMLREIAYGTLQGMSFDDAHQLLAQNIVEPIRLTVPYAEMYNMFFQDQNYTDLEDNAIPIEDIPTVSFETHRDGQIAFIRANYTWTRPEFTTFDVGIEVSWNDLRRAGWNYLQRQMLYATETLARKRDVKAKAALVAALVSGHDDTVTGGSLTRASVKALLKEAATIGFPMTMCLVNAGTVTDMAEWTFPTSQTTSPAVFDQLIQNLSLGSYGGCTFYANPHASTTELWFGGNKTLIGYHQQRGGMKNVSDVDIQKKRDLHAILDMDHAWYIGNAYLVRRLTITA